MALPNQSHVEDTRGRHWDRSYLEHSELFLRGITVSLRSAAAADERNRDRLTLKATALELEADTLSGLIVHNPDGCAGDRLSLILSLLLTCEGEAQLAQALGVPIAYVLAGRDRMFSLAADRVAAGRAGAPQ